MQIDIDEELFEHYQRVKKFYAHVESTGSDRDVISSLNTITTMLKELSKVQTELHNSTTFAQFKEIFINTLKEMDKEAAERVLIDLERLQGEIE